MTLFNNPFIFAPIKLGYSKDNSGKVNEKHINFYSQRSKNIGAITLEPLYLHKSLRELPSQLGIDDDNKIKGLKNLTDIIHKSGTKVIAHLNHPGRMANPKIPGNKWVSSTDKPCENNGSIPKKMDMKKDKKDVLELFSKGAKRAEKAGFDIIEIQFGHGYLCAQFLSPAVNDRKDDYGGTFENRAKFPLEILKTVKNSTSIPIIARISGDEIISNGLHIDEIIKFCKTLEKEGVAAIHVTAGTVCSTPPWFFQHMFIPKGKTWKFADKIKENINIPVIYVGRINSKKDVEDLQNNHKAEFLAVGRAIVADPNFTGKCLGIIKGNIKPCMACAEGCLGGVKSGKGLHCLVNPEVGTDFIKKSQKFKNKKVAIVGGGLTGMEAAVTLKKLGHQVDLFEKEELGGQFKYAPLTPYKSSMNLLIPYYKEELKDLKVKIIKKEAKTTDLTKNYNSVILATGSIPSVPEIKGLKNYYWAEILLKENLPKRKNILIIGGGLIGVDIATALIPENNKVTMVKRTENFGEDMEIIAKNLSLKILKEKGTIFSDHTHIKEIDNNTVYGEKNGKPIKFENIDLIVISTGMRSYSPLENKLKGKVNFIVAGDAKKVGNAEDAIREGHMAALAI